MLPARVMLPVFVLISATVGNTAPVVGSVTVAGITRFPNAPVLLGKAHTLNCAQGRVERACHDQGQNSPH